MEPVSLRFAAAARALAEVARALELEPPGFRSPPHGAALARSLRRHPGGVVVSVQVRDRPWTAVLADLVEGLAVANRLAGADADRCRTASWAHLEARGLVGAVAVPAGDADARGRAAA